MLNIIVEQITSLGDGVLMIGSLAYILGVRKGKSKYLVLFMLLQYLCAQYLIQLPVQQFILGIAVNIGMCYVCLKESWRSWCLWSIIIMILFSGDFTGNRRTDVGTDYRKYFHKNLLYLNCKTVAGDIDMGSDDTEKKQSVFKMAGVAVNFTDSDCSGIYPD